MPKGIAICTCRGCGNHFEKELITYGKGASKELSEKVKWAEEGGIDLCAECWKKEQEAKGLICDIRLPNPSDVDDYKLYAIFSGDSYRYREQLTAMGAVYTRYYPEGKVIADVIGLVMPKKAWVLRYNTIEEAQSELEALCSEINYPSEQEILLWQSWRAETLEYRAKAAEQEAHEQAERAAKRQEALDKLGPIPAWPENIRAKWPDGATWNGKIYGKKGNRCIYLSGEKIDITDDDAAEMERTYEARRTWREQKKALESI